MATKPLSKISMEGAVLKALVEGDIADSLLFAKAQGVSHDDTFVGVLKSLATDAYVELTTISRNFFVLTDEALRVVENGSPEVRLARAVLAAGAAGATVPSLMTTLGDPKSYKAGFSQCMKQRWVALDKKTNTVTAKIDAEPADVVAQQLRALQAVGGFMDRLDDAARALPLDEAAVKALKRRQLLDAKTLKSFSVAKGPAFALQRKKAAADLTAGMLTSGSWRTERFKAYNYNSLGSPAEHGLLHPLLRVRAEFRAILLEMGFQEMPTNQWVESSFWNFDTLFQPQSHPARDAHDTFFLKGGAGRTLRVPEDYYERVKKIHEEGGHGSRGYGVIFDREEAMKNLLRTHTTAWSSQMLYRLAQSEGGFKPSKYFSIDRVFRNETMDATHLCEFHQVEGWVADYNLSLGDLIGVINSFFNKIGITQIRFKPAFNPYTEPSMEIFAYHPTLKKWTEVGNSGIFRPEMLAPMGLPDNVRVIAWGLSVERPTMIKYGINNIRTLFGHKIDLNQSRRAPVCRLDESRHEVKKSSVALQRAAASARGETATTNTGAGAGVNKSSAKKQGNAKAKAKASAAPSGSGSGAAKGTSSVPAPKPYPYDGKSPLRVHADECASALGLLMIGEAGGMKGLMVPTDAGPSAKAPADTAKEQGQEQEKEKAAPKKEKPKRQMTQEELDRIAKSKADSAARKAAKGSQKQAKGKGKGKGGGGGGGGGGKKKGAPVDPNQPEITKLDIRVGQIKKVWRHETADKLYCEEIDVGEDAPRQIASGLVPHYTLEQMQDKRLLVFCNLKARNLVGFKSHGMVLCAAKEVDGKEVVEFIDPPAGAKVGERISVEGLSGEPVTPAQVDKKKVFVNAVPDLKTSADRVATWKGHAFMTSAGPCTAPTLADAVMR